MTGLFALLRRVGGSAYAMSAWTTIAFTLTAGVAGVIATRALGPYERGLLATAVVWSSVAGSLSLYGFPGVATYFVARDRGRRARTGSTILAIGGLAGVALAIAGGTTALLIAGPAAGPPLAVAFLGLAPGIAAGAALGAILGLGRFRSWGVLRVYAPALGLVGTIVVVAVGWRSALAITCVTAIAVTSQLVLLLAVLRKQGLLARPSRTLVRPVLAFTSRNVAAGAGWLVAVHLDQLILSVAVSPARLGVYAVAVSFGTIIQGIASSAGSVALQRVSEGGKPAARRSLQRGLTGAMCVALGLSAVTFAAAPQVMRLLFGDSFESGVGPLRVLLVGTLALVAASVLADVLRGLGHPLLPGRAALAGAAVTVVGLPLLLPSLGILGAAIVSTASYVAMMLVMVRSTRRALRDDVTLPAELSETRSGRVKAVQAPGLDTH